MPTPEPSSFPEQPATTAKPRRWRLVKCVAGGLFACIAILITAAWLFLNFWIAPRIDQYRTDLEQIIFARTGVTLQVGAISAQRAGIFPRITLHNIRLLHPNGQTALSLETVHTALSFKALLALDLRFSELVLQNPVIDIQRQSNGHILIAGIEITPNPRPTPWAPGNDITLPNWALWLLRQPEIRIVQGKMQWTDASNNAPTFELTAVDMVMRNEGKTHHIQTQATPPTSWGERFTLRGDFTEPASAPSKQLRNWSGTGHALFPHANIEQLNHYIALPIEIAQGRGFVEATGQYQQGELIQTRATLNLQEVEIQTSPNQPSIHLQNLQGTLDGSWQQNTYRVQSDNLSFHTPPQLRKDGTTLPPQTWGPSRWDIRWQFDDQGALTGGAIQTQDVDLEVIAQLAQRLPLPGAVQTPLTQINPKGYVENLNLQWQNLANQPRTYHFAGNIRNLTLTPGIAQPPPPDKKMLAARPGVNNLNTRFEINEKTGHVELDIEEGTLSLPGIFEHSNLPVKHASLSLNWQHLENGQIRVNSPDLEIITDDAQLRAQVHWISPDPQDASDRAGFFKLTGILSNGKATAVHRYLPMTIQKKVRDYLKEALIAGFVPQAHVTIEGPLADFPYHESLTGTFLIEGQAQNVTLDFAPKVARPADQGPWPILTHINGQAQFTGKGMVIRNATGRVMNAPDTRVTVQEVSIPDWGKKDTHVMVSATLEGSVSQQLQVINDSTLGRDILQGLLNPTTATGSVSTQLNLDILVERMKESQIKGKVTLNGNTVSLWPFLPELQQVQGHLIFTEKGITIPRLDAHALGGTVQGQVQWDMKQGLNIQAHGSLSAQGLLNDPNWQSMLFPEMQWLQGQSTYTVKADSADPLRRIHIQSDLTGLRIQLPEPLQKSELEPYPLHITISPLTQGNRYMPLSIELAAQSPSAQRPSIHANYIWDETAQGVAITQGAIGVNQAPVMPITGTSAQVRLDNLNLSHWQSYLATLPPNASAAYTPSPANLILPAWWPQTTDAQIGQIHLSDNFIANNARIHLQRNQDNWNAQINADEIMGQLAWLAQTQGNPTSSLLRARFSRLWLPEINLLKTHNETSASALPKDTPFALLPNTQIQIDHLRFGDLELGQLSLHAHIDRTVVPTRWQIDQLQVTTDHSVLTVNGYWANTPVPTTLAQLTLTTQNTGQLLTQLGFPHIIADAPGQLQGELSWQAIPYQLDRQTLRGHLALQLGKGEFLVNDPGAGRLLGALSLHSLPNRLAMDFRDIAKNGLAFNDVNGTFVVNNGILNISTLLLNGINASVQTTGQINLINQTQQLQVVVKPEVNAGAASLALITINPAAGLGSLVVQMLLREPLRAAATRTYYVSGAWKKPRVSTQPHRMRSKPKTDQPKKLFSAT